MEYPINYNDISKEIDYYTEVIQVYKKASLYLKSFDWCKKIENAVLYTNLGSKLCLFLFKIDNRASAENHYLWVIAGDLPSMYLNVQNGDTTREILTSYVELAEDWIQHVKNQESLIDCYPFDADSTEEMADLLKRRVNILKNSVINNIDNIAYNRVSTETPG
jgi:hypothetical protein